ncbi:MAG: hypothetical protein QM691_04420 [Opitutaceae bacterium]
MTTETQATVPSRRNIVLTAVVIGACFLIFLGVLVVAYIPHWRADSFQTLYTTQEVTRMVQEKKIEEGDAWRYSLEGRVGRLAELRGKEQTAATSYAWVDKNAGVVRLPVDRAMELIVSEQARTR